MKRGGTGSRSELEEQPDFLPDLCESGTPNTVGLAGLLAGLEFVMKEGVEKIREHEKHLPKDSSRAFWRFEGSRFTGPKMPKNNWARFRLTFRGWRLPRWA